VLWLAIGCSGKDSPPPPDVGADVGAPDRSVLEARGPDRGVPKPEGTKPDSGPPSAWKVQPASASEALQAVWDLGDERLRRRQGRADPAQRRQGLGHDAQP
jgi:hypothetical protein